MGFSRHHSGQTASGKSKSDATLKAQFLAASAPLSGYWLLALPVASCGLKLDDEAVRVAVALRLGGATENARHEFAAPVCTGGNCGK